jgi:hypothetical protein
MEVDIVWNGRVCMDNGGRPLFPHLFICAHLYHQSFFKKKVDDIETPNKEEGKRVKLNEEGLEALVVRCAQCWLVDWRVHRQSNHHAAPEVRVYAIYNVIISLE